MSRHQALANSRRLSNRTPKSRPIESRGNFRSTIESLELRQLFSSDIESLTGVGNNLAHTTWGGANTDLLRVSPAAYADGKNLPALPNAPSARTISNALSDQTDPGDPSQDKDVLNSQSLSDFVYVWGQFIDHDMDLTPDGGESFPISVAANDPIGTQPFTRSIFDPATGKSMSNPRQQVNVSTSYLDLSQVYGVDTVTASALRTGVDGLMKTSAGNMLPYNNSTYLSTPLAMANDAHFVSDSELFATGDKRGNENSELTALQTLFVRNHNRLAGQIKVKNPGWSDEQIYQEARKLNIAEEQSITYNEFLPALLGKNALGTYTGYNSNVNASIANDFSTVLFRFGHSMLDNEVGRVNNNGSDINDPAGAEIDLAQDFFNPHLLNPAGVVDPLTGKTSTNIDPILKSAASGIAQETDLLAVRDIRNLLFGPVGAGGQDLIARDIQRDRDNGIADYNTMRAAYGLRRVTSFAQITRDTQVQQKLQQLFGSVDKIDAFVGALAEDHVPGSDVGSLVKAGLSEQFSRLRAGDRFFYLNERFNGDEQRTLLAGNTLAKVIEANTGVSNLQDNVFVFRSSIAGTVYSLTSLGGRAFSFPGQGNSRSPVGGLAGVTVQLQDTAGDVLYTATTDADGRYHFDELSGINATGTYVVHVVTPSASISLLPKDGSIKLQISRGDISLQNVSFLVASRTGPFSNSTLAGIATAGSSTLTLPGSDVSLLTDALTN